MKIRKRIMFILPRELDGYTYVWSIFLYLKRIYLQYSRGITSTIFGRTGASGMAPMWQGGVSLASFSTESANGTFLKIVFIQSDKSENYMHRHIGVCLYMHLKGNGGLLIGEFQRNITYN